MSLKLVEIKALIEECRVILCKAKVTAFDRVGQRTYQIGFSKNKQQFLLLLCLQDPFLRFHLSTSTKVPLKPDEVTKSAQVLLGTVLQSIELINDDRIVSWDFGLYLLVTEFFSKKPNLFLLENQKIIASLNSTQSTEYAPPPKPDYVPTELSPVTSHDIEVRYQELEEKTHFLEIKNRMRNVLSARLKRLHKRLRGCLHEIERFSQWPEIHQEGLLIQSNLYRIHKGMPEISVEDWSHDSQLKVIPLDLRKEPHDIAEERFHLAKKWHQALPSRENLRKELEGGIQHHQTLFKTLEKIESPEELEKFSESVRMPQAPLPEKRKPPQEKRQPYHIYHSAKGLPIFVGRTAKDNEDLTFRFAQGNDWWLHVHGVAGSHVILRAEKGKDPDSVSIQDACQLAIYHSKARNKMEGEVAVTQRKYVSRLGKQVGKVQLSKHKVMYVKLDSECIKRLRGSALPNKTPSLPS